MMKNLFVFLKNSYEIPSTLLQELEIYQSLISNTLSIDDIKKHLDEWGFITILSKIQNV